MRGAFLLYFSLPAVGIAVIFLNKLQMAELLYAESADCGTSSEHLSKLMPLNDFSVHFGGFVE